MATTNGFFPGDYDMARAIAQMWKRVGIEAKIEVIEQPKYFELNRANKLPEATLYSWDNATGDPEMFAGYLLHPKLPFSAWKDMGVGEGSKLFEIVDYDQRVEGYREKFAVTGAAMPLLQAGHAARQGESQGRHIRERLEPRSAHLVLELRNASRAAATSGRGADADRGSPAAVERPTSRHGE